jgi:hypothetical protein
MRPIILGGGSSLSKATQADVVGEVKMAATARPANHEVQIYRNSSMNRHVSASLSNAALV